MLRKAAELIVTLSHKDIRKSFHEKNFAANTLGKTANALEAASVEPPPLAHITTIRELFEVIDWDFDGSGLTVTDGNLLANTIANTFPALKNDMPHLVTE